MIIMYLNTFHTPKNHFFLIFAMPCLREVQSPVLEKKKFPEGSQLGPILPLYHVASMAVNLYRDMIGN